MVKANKKKRFEIHHCDKFDGVIDEQSHNTIKFDEYTNKYELWYSIDDASNYKAKEFMFCLFCGKRLSAKEGDIATNTEN